MTDENYSLKELHRKEKIVTIPGLYDKSLKIKKSDKDGLMYLQFPYVSGLKAEYLTFPLDTIKKIFGLEKKDDVEIKKSIAGKSLTISTVFSLMVEKV